MAITVRNPQSLSHHLYVSGSQSMFQGLLGEGVPRLSQVNHKVKTILIIISELSSLPGWHFYCWYKRNCGAGEGRMRLLISSVQFSSFTQSCPTLCNPMNHSMSGLPVHHQLPEFTQTHVHWIGDAIQPSYPLSSPSPPALNLSQHQSLFKWVSSPHQVVKVLEFQLQHQSFQWIFRADFL